VWLENGNLNGYISSLENEYNSRFLLIDKPTKIEITHHYGVMYSAIENLGTLLRFQNEQIVKDNYLYSLEIVAPEENYATYASIFKHEINSFSLLD
jgi:hypothetical protein